MNYRTVAIQEWLKNQPLHDLLDLASSGMPSIYKLADLELDQTEVPLYGSNAYGYMPLKEQIAAQFSVNVDRVVITPGASMANFVIFSALLERGDKVMVENPVYMPLCEAAEAIIEQEILPYERLANSGWHLNPDPKQVCAIKPRLLVLTNPHNPSGAYDPPQLFARYANLVEEWGGHVLLDEIFQPFMPYGETVTAAQFSDSIIVTGSLTKVWGLGGLRIGWVIAPPEIARKIERTMNFMHVVQPFVTEFIAWKVLSNYTLNQRMLTNARARAEKHWAIVQEWFSRQDKLTIHKPAGGIIAMVTANNPATLDIDQLCATLLEREKTLVIPGRYFGFNNGFRIGFGAEPAVLNAGLERLSAVLKEQ